MATNALDLCNVIVYTNNMKTEVINVRVKKEVKDRAMKYFKSIGLTLSSGVNMYLIKSAQKANK